MTPIRLALVRQRYNPFGGAERFVERAMGALAGQPLALTLITRQWSGSPQHEIRVCNPFHIGRLWRDIGFARCVRRTIERERFDLVQSHERIPGCDIYRAGDGVHATWIEQLGRARKPLARLGLRINPWHRYTLAAEARMFRHPRLRAVICNSRMVRDDIAQRFALGDDKLHVIYNGVDLLHFHPGLRAELRAATRRRLGIAEDACVVLFVGSGFERKGVGVLIEALAQRPDPRTVLLVVGRDKHQQRYAELAARRGVAQRVRFLGGQDDVRPYYGAADILALPTLYDPMPNAVLEGLACGLPAITSRSSGAAELIDAGRNGYVCDALDVAAIAGFLAELGRPGAAESMRSAARAAVQGRGLDAMGAQLLDLYRALLGTPQRSGGAPKL